MTRPNERAPLASECVAPGLHTPRAGTHAVVWWDPHVHDLDRAVAGGLRQRQILQADALGETAAASARAHAEWQDRRTRALAAGSTPSLVVQSVTQAARTIDAGDSHVAIEDTGLDRSGRPGGKRFGTLVHAVLAAVDFRADEAVIRLVAANQARLVGASSDEREAAVVAVRSALSHPLLSRAAAADARGALRREVLVVAQHGDSLIEGIVDLAFSEHGPEGDTWTVVDFKTDSELSKARTVY